MACSKDISNSYFYYRCLAANGELRIEGRHEPKKNRLAVREAAFGEVS
jgi:hypothetical protein